METIVRHGVSGGLLGSSFSEVFDEIEAEARAGGPEAITVNEFFRQRAWLASALLRARLDAGLSQAELAERAGLKQSEVSKIENRHANPTFDRLAQVARALGYRFDLVPINSERAV